MPCMYTASELNDNGIHRHSADGFASSDAVPHFQPRLPLFPEHLSLKASFDIKSRTVKATASHRVVAKWDAAKTLTLNAEDFLKVHVTSSDDQNLKYNYDGHRIEIVFAEELKKGDIVSVDVEYELHDPIDGLCFSNEKDGHFVFSDHETERARYWLPVVDHPVVRTTISFSLLTPVEEDLTVLANGDFVSEEKDDKQKTTKWEMKQVTPSYLIHVAIGKFIRVDAGEHNGKKLAYFAPEGGRYPYTEGMLNRTFGRTKEMIEFMEKKVHFELPWPKYFQVCCGFAGGAMENSSLVYFDEWYLLDERSAPERAYRVDSTVVHELAHTWFGDTVVCSDFCHSFLKEAFATFISAEWYHYKNGNDDFQLALTRYAEVSFAETNSYIRPIVTRTYDSSWDLFDRHLYTNGAWRLHMLRNKLGDKTFWEAVSSYLHKRAWTTVETDDFRRDLEKYSGEQLCSYFEQWFYGKGHPILEATFSYDPSKGGYSSISIRQIQKDKYEDIHLFDITIDVAIETSADKWETHTIFMESDNECGQIVLTLASRPLQVIIDPEKKVLHALSEFRGVGEDMSLRALSHAPTFAGRYQAVKQLHKAGSKRARAGLCTAVSEEKHWGLRCVLASTLGNLTRIDAIPALISALSKESDGRVIPVILQNLHKFDDPATEAVLLKFVNEGHSKKRGYGAIGTALHGLGRHGHIEHLDLLTSFLEDPKKGGGNFLLTYNAASGLGELRDWRATEVLMRNANPPNMLFPERVRCAVVRAIGTGVERETRNSRIKAFEFIKKIVEGADVKGVRISAGGVLAKLADVGDAITPLLELEKFVENQEKGTVQEMRELAYNVRMNRAEGSTKDIATQMEKMRKEIEDLNSTVDSMKAKIDSLCKESKNTTDNKDNNSKPVANDEAKEKGDANQMNAT